jgi:hypothetical protein
MRRTFAIGALALLVLAAGCGSNKASTTSARVTTQAGATSVNLYTPFAGGSIAARIQVVRTISGFCWTSSLADGRSDAFRCMVKNTIYDPCFAWPSGSGRFVLCPAWPPDSPRVIRIDLTRKLPAPNPAGNPTRYPPWAVQTDTGEWCAMITGASGEIAGMRIEYGCSGGGILLGDPHRKSEPWTIFYAPSYKARHFQQIALRSAWW